MSVFGATDDTAPVPHSWDMRIFSKAAMFGCAVAMALTACGGASPDGLLEAAAQAAGADTENISFGTDDVSASFGDADITFGAGGASERPDWLGPQYLWPEGFEAGYAINDPSTGEMGYVGVVPGADLAALQAEQDQLLVAAGYERLGDSTIYVQAGQPSIDVLMAQAPDSVQIDVSHRFEDETTLRDTHAPVEGTGTMTAVLDGETLTFEGPCSLRSTTGNFSTDDPMVSATDSQNGSVSVGIREGEQNYITADIIKTSETEFASWAMLQVDDAGNYPTITVDDQGFAVEGFMTSFVDGTTVPVSIVVTCG